MDWAVKKSAGRWATVRAPPPGSSARPKYCGILGTTLAGVVADEDRVALAYLRSSPDVLPARVGTIGLSGGGCRAALLAANLRP